MTAPARAQASGRVTRLTTRIRQFSGREADPALDAKAMRLVLRELLFDGEPAPQWRRSASCASPDVDPEVFFPPDGWANEVVVAAAKRICGGCSVRATCLGDVLAWEDPHQRLGVVGGLTPAERSHIAGGEP